MYSCVSAPGKVLLAGGYLVVDRSYTGLVFGLSARIHVVVGPVLPFNPSQSNEVHVKSPQFLGAEWRYSYRVLESDGGVGIVQLQSHSNRVASKNKFVDTTLAYVLSYISSYESFTIRPIRVTIMADDDYYSQSVMSAKCSSKVASRFKEFNVSLDEANKTGLGSSAALVTALTASVLAYFVPDCKEHLGSDLWKNRIHNLAQVAHCMAQGKIGSGFDVAAAVFGSCVYRRFSPSILERISDVGSMDHAKKLRRVVDNNDPQVTWDAEIGSSAIQMPRGLRLVMCDVDCGSETPGMVRRVFAWRREKEVESSVIWSALQKGNEELANELVRLSTDQTPSYEKLANLILTLRGLIRDMSEKAKVPIEPPVQSELLDSCSKIPGVVGGVVPGAGGYDALVLIIEDKIEVLKQLETHLSNYKSKTVQDNAVIGNVRLLETKQEMEGLLIEPESVYTGWL